MARFPATRPVRTPIITGPFFDDPFFATPSPPPLGICDPCYQAWLATLQWAQQLPICLGEGAKTEACNQVQTRFIETARAYADCMDQAYGLGLFRATTNGGNHKG